MLTVVLKTVNTSSASLNYHYKIKKCVLLCDKILVIPRSSEFPSFPDVQNDNSSFPTTATLSRNAWTESGNVLKAEGPPSSD